MSAVSQREIPGSFLPSNHQSITKRCPNTKESQTRQDKTKTILYWSSRVDKKRFTKWVHCRRPNVAKTSVIRLTPIAQVLKYLRIILGRLSPIHYDDECTIAISKQGVVLHGQGIRYRLMKWIWISIPVAVFVVVAFISGAGARNGAHNSLVRIDNIPSAGVN